tara:strand:- start:6714 stop:7010 length:297 start_codon:yes stop_codon:yes gene_type:complete
MIGINTQKIDIVFLHIGDEWYDIFRVLKFVADIGINPITDKNLLESMRQEGLVESDSEIMNSEDYIGLDNFITNLYIPIYDSMNKICNQLERTSNENM